MKIQFFEVSSFLFLLAWDHFVERRRFAFTRTHRLRYKCTHTHMDSVAYLSSPDWIRERGFFLFFVAIVLLMLSSAPCHLDRQIQIRIELNERRLTRTSAWITHTPHRSETTCYTDVSLTVQDYCTARSGETIAVVVMHTSTDNIVANVEPDQLSVYARCACVSACVFNRCHLIVDRRERLQLGVFSFRRHRFATIFFPHFISMCCALRVCVCFFSLFFLLPNTSRMYSEYHYYDWRLPLVRATTAATAADTTTKLRMYFECGTDWYHARRAHNALPWTNNNNKCIEKYTQWSGLLWWRTTLCRYYTDHSSAHLIEFESVSCANCALSLPLLTWFKCLVMIWNLHLSAIADMHSVWSTL